jgi:hypothetical protein
MGFVLGLGGKKRSGKDTSADILVKEFGYTKLSFGDDLKHLCQAMTGIPLKNFYEESLKDTKFSSPLVLNKTDLYNNILDYFNKTESLFQPTDEKIAFSSPREIMQVIGTDIVRKTLFDNNFWITFLSNKIKQIETPVVIADMRFSHERKFIKELGGITCRIKREEADGSGDSHSSENDLGEDSEYDFVLLNNGSMSELRSSVRQLEKLGQRAYLYGEIKDDSKH